MVRLFCVVAWVGVSLGDMAFAAEPQPRPVRILVWDEQQPEQRQAYGKHLGETLAEKLAERDNVKVTAVHLGSPEQGLSQENLDAADVVIWWGHKKHTEVDKDRAEEVVRRVLDGKLALIALHSAHFAQPFMRLMHERAKADAIAQLPAAEAAKLDVSAPLQRKLVTRTAPLTPAIERKGDSVKLIPPACVFPAWRADAAPSHVTTLLPDHPIAAGLPKTWDIPRTEMYDEPFHVPAPDAVVFEERWDKGEHFRSGCLWTVGKGHVFYFRPGHETYAIYTQAEPLLVLENAARHLAPARRR